MRLAPAAGGGAVVPVGDGQVGQRRGVIPGQGDGLIEQGQAPHGPADVGPFTWQDRIDMFSAAISANPPAPDIISMTESAGLWHWDVVPFRHADDYDLVDRLISNLQKSMGIRYRVAYLVGASGAIKNFLGTPHCWYYSGDTVLYNPARVSNLTPGDVAGLPQESHDGPLIGFQVCRSLPLCVRGSTLEPLDRLIDGLPQIDRCNVPTPSGPAWTQVDLNRGGDLTLVASLARFSLVDVPGSSFDVVTTHPMAHEEEDHAQTINSFISALIGVAEALAPTDPDRAERIANSITDEYWKASALASVAKALAAMSS